MSPLKFCSDGTRALGGIGEVSIDTTALWILLFFQGSHFNYNSQGYVYSDKFEQAAIGVAHQEK